MDLSVRIVLLLLMPGFSASQKENICLQVMKKPCTFVINESDPPGTKLFSVDERVRDHIAVRTIYTNQRGRTVLLNDLIQLKDGDLVLQNSWSLSTLFNMTNEIVHRAAMEILCNVQSKDQASVVITYPITVNADAKRAIRFLTDMYLFVAREDAKVGDRISDMRHQLALGIGELHEFHDPTYGNFSLEATTTDASRDLTRYVVMTNIYFGNIRLARRLDYETMQGMLEMNVVHINPANQTTKTKIYLALLDAPDAVPDFYTPSCPYPCLVLYRASVSRTYKGQLSLSPANIKARSGNSDDPPILYSFKDGSPKNYSDYVKIDSSSGKVFIVQKIAEKSIKRFHIVVEAREDVLFGAMTQTTTLAIEVDDDLTIRRQWMHSTVLMEVALALSILNIFLCSICFIVFWTIRVKDRRSLRRLRNLVCCSRRRDSHVNTGMIYRYNAQPLPLGGQAHCRWNAPQGPQRMCGHPVFPQNVTNSATMSPEGNTNPVFFMEHSPTPRSRIQSI